MATSEQHVTVSSHAGHVRRVPGLRPLATPRRGPSRLQPRPRASGSATSFSRFLGFSGWADSLAAESPAVLLHAGFGIQLLSMPVGEGGAGLSLGKNLLNSAYLTLVSVYEKLW